MRENGKKEPLIIQKETILRCPYALLDVEKGDERASKILKGTNLREGGANVYFPFEGIYPRNGQTSHPDSTAHRSLRGR